MIDTLSDFSFIKAPIEMLGEAKWVEDRLTDAYTHCGVEAFVAVNYDWCMANTGTCQYGEKLIDRLLNNGVKIIKQFGNWWGLLNQLSSCSTDVERLDGLEQGLAGLSWMVSVIVGFTWDKQPPTSHLSLWTMQQNLESKKIGYVG